MAPARIIRLVFLCGCLAFADGRGIAAGSSNDTGVGKRVSPGQSFATAGGDTVVWRDPFQFSGAQKASEFGGIKPTQSLNPKPLNPVSPLILRGIIEGDNGRIALVNGRLVRAGETVGGRKIRSITRYSIVVEGVEGDLEISILAASQTVMVSADK